MPYERRVNKDGNAKPHIDLEGDTVEERTRFFLKRYWQNYDKWDKYSKQIGVKTEFTACLAWSETSLWYAKKSKDNYFNCGNNDRGDTVDFDWLAHAFRWLGRSCLNGTYSKHKTTLSHLNPYSSLSTCKTHPYDPWCHYAYATSDDKGGWMPNMLNCLSNIYQKTISPEFLFRL